MIQTRRIFGGVVILLAACATLALALPGRAGDAATEATAAQGRLSDDLKYLASDELEGRGVGTKGLDLAADYIRDQFAKAGLDVTRVNGGAFQPLTMTIGSSLGTPNQLVFNGPEGKKIELALSKDFTPLSFGGSGPISGELVFGGYGISAPDHKYDDFANIDIKGKVVVLMRRVPQQANPDGPFSGHKGGAHEALLSKVSNAMGRDAAAVIFVSDPYSARNEVVEAQKMAGKLAEAAATATEEFLAVDPADAAKVEEARKKVKEELAKYKTAKGHVEQGEPDTLLAFNYGGNDSMRSAPILHITRAACDQLLKASLNKTLTQIEADINKDFKPQSAVLTGWTASGQASIEREKVEVKNVIGVLEGEGPLKDETIVIGAHYDHVGRGGAGSLAPGSKEIHNGADDNASGTVTLLELARRFGAMKGKLPRRLVFIAFTGEERGLIGSAHYVREPVFPLDKTVAMINMDMVGRLLDDKLTVFGTGTSPGFKDLVEKLGKEASFTVISKPEGFGPSDHSSFYKMKIPVLHLFTGTHTDYHRPGDDWEKVNFPGMQRITDLIERLTNDVLNGPERPAYVAVQGQAQIERSGSRPYFGSIPDFGTDKPGYALGGVAGGSPAEKAGLKAGDRIIALGMTKIENLEDFDLALRRFSAGDTIDVTVMRGNDKVTVKLTLDKPRG